MQLLSLGLTFSPEDLGSLDDGVALGLYLHGSLVVVLRGEMAVWLVLGLRLLSTFLSFCVELLQFGLGSVLGVVLFVDFGSLTYSAERLEFLGPAG